MQHKATADTACTMEQKLTAYREELERMDVFKYLGRLVVYNDNDAQAVRANLKNA